MRTKIAIFLCCMLALALTGCGKNLPKPERPEIQALSASMQQSLEQEIRGFGANINTYKALGKVALKKNNQLVLSGRAGWTAEAPDKLSLVAFAAGIPVMRLACNGQKIYYADSFQNNNKLIYYSAPNDPDIMYDYMGIYISTQSLLSLWMGKLMPPGYSVIGYNNSGDFRCIILRGQGGDMRYIYFHKQTNSVMRIDDFTSDGGLKYSAYWAEMQNIGGSGVPFKLIITNTKNADLEFYIDNIWINEPTNPEMFVIWPE